MTATTYTNIAGVRQGVSSEGWLSRFFARMIEGQEREARKRVRQHLGALSDDHLTGLGFSPHEIRQLRHGGGIARPAV